MPRQSTEPLLLWLVNSWHVAEPLLRQATEKLDPKHDSLILDLRTPRGVSVATLDHATVIGSAKVAEITALRQTLMHHPFLYNSRWCRTFAIEMKKHLKKHQGANGCCCIFACGDAPEHAPDQQNPLPDFNMEVKPYFVSDLHKIAEASLAPLRAAPSQ